MSSNKVSSLSHWVVRNPHPLCNLGKTRPFNSTHWHLKKEILLILALGSHLLFPTTGILKEFPGKYLIGKKMVQGGWCVMYLYIFYVLFVFDDVVNSVVCLLGVKNVFQVGIHGDLKHSAYFVVVFI